MVASRRDGRFNAMPRRLLFLAAYFVLADHLPAEEWPTWRGPRLDGTSTEKNLPLTWRADQNIAWKTPIPGIGHSSPVIFGERIFITTCLLKTKERLLICLDRASGKEVGRRVVLISPLEPKHQLNSYASSTPAADGKNVYVAFLRIRDKKPGDPYPIHPREKG